MKGLGVLALGVVTAALSVSGIAPSFLNSEAQSASNFVVVSASPPASWLDERIDRAGDWSR